MNRLENPGNRTLRPGGIGGNVRAHAQLRAAAGACGVMDEAGGDVVRTHLHSSGVRLPLRSADESDWMSRYFFTGGIMPSDDLLLYFQRDVKPCRPLAGVRDATTSARVRRGLQNMDANRAALMPLFGADLRRGSGDQLVGLLAGVLHVLRGVVGFPRRPRMARLALPVREALGSTHDAEGARSCGLPR